MTTLRIAVPNKGSLSLPSDQLLTAAGYRVHRGNRELMIDDARNDVRFFFLRPRDIALYVGSGTLDAGITGRDLLLDADTGAEEVLPLGYSASTFRFAARPGELSAIADLEGKRVATSYPGLVAAHLAEHGVAAKLVRLDGAVETSVQLGIADAVADVVETGTSLRNSGLAVFGEPILQSEAVLIRRPDADDAVATAVERVRRRLKGVLIARQYVMIDYDCPTEVQEAACALTPGIESPTVSPLAREGWVAVRSLVPRDRAPFVMDELWEVGARAILVTPLESSRI
ncbi:ATP phosphoribosyltransferase [Actinokineospora globicatena]|uniref:ATP phosphoribosyltransferase n=1 Tax=Actinokineospora globicatena TaxID=103729 RepID=UPI0020A3A8A7|nr:ATP phosphoribosyltransferase [Actinokineospora globicatena]MCP2306885.1 ATP phosphoribosyltransferase [Actinokineospora globicatena]GLW82328.1 ATP phosphoribosyltransferase [Actinokineospora globicatena]GLW89079.1 ATP phosphoribosyltransferase [Actinokineospora globicatena]